jgi:hypothetical protein
MVLPRSWLALTIPIGLIALGLLAWTVVSLVRTVRGAIVMSVPLREEQRVTFDRGGELALNLESGSFLRNLGGLGFGVSTTGSGTTIPLHPVLFRTEVSSFSRRRLELYSFTLPAAGSYLLRVTGINSAADPATDAIVFTRRFRGALVFHVLALIALGGTFIGSIVVSAFALSDRPLTRDASQSETALGGSLEVAIAQSQAIIRARTVARGGTPRFQVLEVWAGTVSPTIAGAGHSDGLILSLRALTALGFRPVDGQEVIVLLAPPLATGPDSRPSVVLGEPYAVLPVEGDHVLYAPSDAALRRELTLGDLYRLCRRSLGGRSP